MHHSDRGAQYRPRPLRGRPGRDRGDRICRSKGDSFWLRSGRGTQLAAQGRADSQPSLPRRARPPGKASTLPLVATAEQVHRAGTTRPHSATGIRAPAEHEHAHSPSADNTDTNNIENMDQQTISQPQPATTDAR